MNYKMNIIVFVITILFVCQAEAKKSKKKKKARYEDGGIQILDFTDPEHVYHKHPAANGGHKQTLSYFDDPLELYGNAHYGPPKDPYTRYKKAKKIRKFHKQINKAYKKKVHSRVQTHKFVNKHLHKGFNDWGKKLFKKHTYPLFGPPDEVHYTKQKVEPRFVRYEREVYQPSKEPRLVEVRVPKCEPGVEAPYLVTSTLVKKYKHPITITKMKTKTTHVKITEYVVNTSTVTKRLTLPRQTITTYYTATEWETEPSKPAYKAKQKSKHYRKSPAISDYATLMSSMIELLAEKPYTSLFSKGKETKDTDKNKAKKTP